MQKKHPRRKKMKNKHPKQNKMIKNSEVKIRLSMLEMVCFTVSTLTVVGELSGTPPTIEYVTEFLTNLYEDNPFLFEYEPLPLVLDTFRSLTEGMEVNGEINIETQKVFKVKEIDRIEHLFLSINKSCYQVD